MLREVVHGGDVVDSHEEGLVGSGGKEHRGRDHRGHVIDVREAPRLLTVAKHRDGLRPHHLVDENTDGVAEFVGQILSRPVYLSSS